MEFVSLIMNYMYYFWEKNYLDIFYIRSFIIKSQAKSSKIDSFIWELQLYIIYATTYAWLLDTHMTKYMLTKYHLHLHLPFNRITIKNTCKALLSLSLCVTQVLSFKYSARKSHKQQSLSRSRWCFSSLLSNIYFSSRMFTLYMRVGFCQSCLLLVYRICQHNNPHG